VASVGDTTFVMNTRENLFEDQPFRLAAIAAPVGPLRAERVDAGVRLSWPPREGDVRYTIFRRAWPEGVPHPITEVVGVPEYLDAAPLDAPAAYAVAALTNERSAYAGTVGLGEFMIFDRFISPLSEEVRVEP